MQTRNKIVLPAGALDASPKVPTIKCEHSVTDEGVDLAFHDVIGSWYDESTSRDIGRILKENRGKPVNVSINSGGGYVFDGISIFNQLIDHDGHVTTTIEGNAASIASIIALAGDTRRIRDNASIMIHRAWGAVIGNSGQLRTEASILDKIDASLAKTYAARTGDGTPEDWLALMAGPKDSDGTWFTADEAKAAGLVDEVLATEGKEPKKPVKKANTDQGRKVMAEAIAARLRVVEVLEDLTGVQ